MIKIKTNLSIKITVIHDILKRKPFVRVLERAGMLNSSVLVYFWFA